MHEDAIRNVSRPFVFKHYLLSSVLLSELGGVVNIAI